MSSFATAASFSSNDPFDVATLQPTATTPVPIAKPPRIPTTPVANAMTSFTDSRNFPASLQTETP